MVWRTSYAIPFLLVDFTCHQPGMALRAANTWALPNKEVLSSMWRFCLFNSQGVPLLVLDKKLGRSVFFCEKTVGRSIQIGLVRWHLFVGYFCLSFLGTPMLSAWMGREQNFISWRSGSVKSSTHFAISNYAMYPLQICSDFCSILRTSCISVIWFSKL